MSSQQQHRSEESRDSKLDNHLINCDSLKVRQDCDIVRFAQILEVYRLRNRGLSAQSLIHPAQIAWRLKQLAENRADVVAKLQTLQLLMDANQRKKYRFASLRSLESRLRTLNQQHRQESQETEPSTKSKTMKKEDEPRARRAIIAPLSKLDELAPPKKIRPFKPVVKKPGKPSGAGEVQVIDTGQQTRKELQSLLEGLFSNVLVTSAGNGSTEKQEITVGVGVSYCQEWCSDGYFRGRLIRSVPLTADERKQIVVKSWQIKKTRREELESVEENISTEFVGDEKWSQATSKETSVNLSQTLDANLKVNGEVGVPKKGVKAGGSGEVGSKTSAEFSRVVTETEEQISQATVKSANALKKSLSSTVETAEEAGREATITETIVNPNKCHSLTYHYFEVVESFRVKTSVERLVPYVFVPLGYPSMTMDWVLCHECVLKKHLPCDTYYRGFEAAKRLRIGEHLGEFLGSFDNEVINSLTEQAIGLIDQLLLVYSRLSEATINLTDDDVGGGNPPGIDLTDNPFVDKFVEVIDAGLKEYEEYSEDPVGYVKDKGEKLVEVGEKIVDEAGKLAEEGANWLKEGIKEITSPPDDDDGQGNDNPYLFFSTAAGAPDPGGIGSFIYWRVLQVTAPEIESALAGLAAARDYLDSMEPGPVRTRATFNALHVLFATIGNVDEAFRKVDTGLFYLFATSLATLAAGTGIRASLAGVIVLVTGGGVGAAAIAAAAALLGASVTGALGTVGASISAQLGEQAGTSDLIPDDEGLQASIQGLFGLYQMMASLTDETPLPPEASAEAIAAHERHRMERQQRQREMADARVEYDRLACHLKENRAYYAQAIYSAMPEAVLRERLTSEFRIPPYAVEAKISGFSGDRAALRVLDLGWLKQSGMDFDDLLKGLKGENNSAGDKKENLFTREPIVEEITMPTRGIVVEPVLGDCNACDAFVSEHRALDLQLKRAEVAKAEVESKRLKRRVKAGVLGDPTPLKGARNITVEIESAEGLELSTSDATEVDSDQNTDVDG